MDNYETIPVTELDNYYVLVGEMGGFSAVFDIEVFESAVMVHTEHGAITFHPREKVRVTVLHQQSEN